jgi:hypothetical protein
MPVEACFERQGCGLLNYNRSSCSDRARRQRRNPLMQPGSRHARAPKFRPAVLIDPVDRETFLARSIPTYRMPWTSPAR